MTHNIKIKIAAAVLAVFTVTAAVSVSTPIPDLYEYTLPNGLSLYVAENHTVPLVYIEIAVKAGAVAQTPENAGLFHLYEHMMFKGNTKYKDASAVQRALGDMGVASWNGTTGIDCVNYYFTIPSSQLEKGLEFWSYAVREPLMDTKELENEKKVVLSEIQGNASDPGRIFMSYKSQALFPSAPWKLDPAGSVDVVKNATTDQLKTIQHEYYIPGNAALFVGGDVSPDTVFELVNKIYGGWENGENPWKEKSEQPSLSPFPETKWCIMPMDKISADIAEVDVYFRGPDADYDYNDIFAGDALCSYLNNPESTYMKELVNDKVLNIPSAEYVWASSVTARKSSTFNFGAVLVEGDADLVKRVKYFKNKVCGCILPDVIKKNSMFKGGFRKITIQGIKDSRLLGEETSSGLLQNLRAAWVAAGAGYEYEYLDTVEKLKKEDFTRVMNTYIAGKSPLVVVLVNPAVYEKQKDAFAAAGFIKITEENAFWTKRSENEDKTEAQK